MGIVYHANYLVWCEVGRTDFMRQLGARYADIEARGVLLAVSEVNLRLLNSARYDDVLTVETSLADVRSRLIAFEYVMTRSADGARLATARTSLISLCRDRRPTALPTDLRTLLGGALT